MNPRLPFLIVVILVSVLPLRAGWIVQKDSPRLVSSSEPGTGYSSIEEALRALSASGRIGGLDVIFAADLLNDPTFQEELYAALQRDAPRALKEALASSGNMHNPKIVALINPFLSAAMTTPTMSKLNASLAPYGLRIGEVLIEKFELRKNPSAAERKFTGGMILCLIKLPSR